MSLQTQSLASLHGESMEDALLRKGEVLFADGNQEFARQVFLEVLEIDPQRAEAYNNLGCIFFDKGDVEQAEEFFLKAYALERNYLLCAINLADLYKGKRNFSRELFFREEAVRLAPEVAEHWNALALCRLELGHLPEVLEAFRKSLALDDSQEMIRRLLNEFGSLEVNAAPSRGQISIEILGGA